MLPQDFATFLGDAANRTLNLDDGEIRKVTLYSESDIPKKQFDVARYAVDPSYDDIEDREWFDGYDLVEKCNSYSPEGVMIWFPDREEFGQWDADHHTIITFPKTTWRAIMEWPAPYFNCMWEDGVRNVKINPWA